MVAVLGIALFAFAPRAGEKRFDNWLVLLGWLIFLNQGINYVVSWTTGHLSVVEFLPLHLCSITQLLLFAHLTLKQDWAFPITTFWGPLGGMMAIFTPALVHFNTYHLIQFYLAHGAVVLVPLYLLVHGGRRLPEKYWWKVIVLTNVLGLAMMLVNRQIGSNYMYVSRPPPVAPYNQGYAWADWPYYLIPVEIQLFVFVGLLWVCLRRFAK